MQRVSILCLRRRRPTIEGAADPWAPQDVPSQVFPKATWQICWGPVGSLQSGRATLRTHPWRSGRRVVQCHAYGGDHVAQHPPQLGVDCQEERAAEVGSGDDHDHAPYHGEHVVVVEH